MNRVFDSHAHYDDGRFDGDRDQILESLPSKGVELVMNAASDLASARAGICLAEKHAHIYCSVGVHPHGAKDAPENLEEQLTALAAHPKVCSIGEIGLDYHYDFSPRERQREIFERQLQVALKLNMPVIIHDREAHGDTMELLQKYRPKGVVHCYSGSVEMAKELLKMGMYIGFTGVVTFKNARKALEALRVVPMDKLLIETDCPYMAPEPYRGARCDSTMLDRTAEAVAIQKERMIQEIFDATYANACRLYGISVEK